MVITGSECPLPIGVCLWLLQADDGQVQGRAELTVNGISCGVTIDRQTSDNGLSVVLFLKCRSILCVKSIDNHL